MPNWVFNNLSITGSTDLVNEVKAKLAQPYETNHKTMTKDGVQNVKDVHESVLSFWNIISPTDLDAYWGEPTHKVDLDNFAESYTKALAEGGDWWHWNVREWGCKWDAGDVEVLDDIELAGTLTISYKFDTPWSPPLEAIEKLAKQYPDLIINIEYEEEQGWGGDVTLQGENVLQKEEWDIPDSHEELMERKGYCHACDNIYYDKANGKWELDYLFEDCPTPTAAELEEMATRLTTYSESGNVVL